MSISESASAATRTAVLEQMDAFDANDTERLIAGLHDDVLGHGFRRVAREGTADIEP